VISKLSWRPHPHRGPTHAYRKDTEHLGYVESELPFRALPEYDLRTADVALDRSPFPFERTSKDSGVSGIMFVSWAEELWVIDPKRETVNDHQPPRSERGERHGRSDSTSVV
jgi:hypothetical protein